MASKTQTATSVRQIGESPAGGGQREATPAGTKGREATPTPTQRRQALTEAVAAAQATALTALASGAGCGCKLPAAEVLPIVRKLPRQHDPRLLVGAATSDDAAVFKLSEDVALVQTVDFFAPPVDDPYDFGRIAAANAISDVYAMGGRPLTALNIVAFPLRALGADALAAVLAGGLNIVAQAGAVLVGGHSIEDAEPKYGLAVTGIVAPASMLTNAGGRPGDLLTLSKPLGVGAVIAARKRGKREPKLLREAVATMVALNAQASVAALAAGAHAVTDVTGFGLLGHLHHLCRESGVSAVIESEAAPCLDGVEELLRDGCCSSGGSERNAAWTAGFTRFADGVAPWRRRLLNDATTSGGLLAAVPPDCECAPGVVIGRLAKGEPGSIEVR